MRGVYQVRSTSLAAGVPDAERESDVGVGATEGLLGQATASSMDARGRVWLTSTVRRRENPDWCQDGSDHPSARYFPVDRNGRQISVYDPRHRGVGARRHVLRHPPPAVRRGRAGPDPVLGEPERERIEAWLDFPMTLVHGPEAQSVARCPTYSHSATAVRTICPDGDSRSRSTTSSRNRSRITRDHVGSIV